MKFYLKKVYFSYFFHENNNFKKHEIGYKNFNYLKPHVIFQFNVQFFGAIFAIILQFYCAINDQISAVFSRL